MFILFLLLLPFSIAEMLVLWLESEFIVEYAKLFRLNKIIPVFKKFDKQTGSLNFKEFLLKNYDSWFVHLITCSICLSAMLSFVFSMFIGFFYSWPLAFTIWTPLGYFSLYLYEKMKKFLK